MVGPSGLEPPWITYLSLRLRKDACALFTGSNSYLVLLVGPSGLEPPTSCLSGTRSNLLSYEPVWLVWILFTLRFFPFRKFLCLPFFSKKVSGGDDGIRTHDPLLAGQVLSQLSYTPKLNAKCKMQNAKSFRFLLFLRFFSLRSGLLHSLTVSALSYLPVQSPVKYFHHCRA